MNDRDTAHRLRISRIAVLTGMAPAHDTRRRGTFRVTCKFCDFSERMPTYSSADWTSDAVWDAIDESLGKHFAMSGKCRERYEAESIVRHKLVWETAL